MPKHNKIEYPVDQIREWIETDGKTQQWIADQLRETLDKRVTAKLIYKVCKKHQIKCQRTGPRSGEGHPDWKGGRTVNKDGYIEVYSPDHPNRRKHTPYVLEHRLVMEEHLGRYLTRDEVVHHRDGNKQNNAIENLELFQTNAEHLRQTLKGQCPKWSGDGRRRIAEAQKNRRPPHWTDERRAKQSRTTRLQNAIGNLQGLGGLVTLQEVDHHLSGLGIYPDSVYEMDEKQFGLLLDLFARRKIELEMDHQYPPHSLADLFPPNVLADVHRDSGFRRDTSESRSASASPQHISNAQGQTRG
jgi:hypothetical protein